MIEYSIAGFSQRDFLLRRLVEIQEAHRDLFRPGVVFARSHDSFPGCIWNGGRVVVGAPRSRADMEECIEFYNSHGVGICYTYSNLLLEEEHLDDPLGNLTLELAHREMNSVVVASPLLERYVRERFPAYGIKSSCCLNDLDRDAIRARMARADALVLPPELNRDLDFLASVDRSRLEILVDHGCVPYCPDKTRHYQAISASQLRRHDDGFLDAVCAMEERWKDLCHVRKDPARKGSLALSPGDVDELNRLGISRFKMGSRFFACLPGREVAHLARYLIREACAKEFEGRFRDLAVPAGDPEVRELGERLQSIYVTRET